jgi:hypothetical protein
MKTHETGVSGLLPVGVRPVPGLQELTARGQLTGCGQCPKLVPGGSS